MVLALHYRYARRIQSLFPALFPALCLVLLLTCFTGAAPAQALSVNDARIGLHSDKTRMVLELDRMSVFRTFVLADPWRLVVDMPAFQWNVGKISNPKQSPVATIRQGTLQPGISRIVVDLERPVIISNAFLLRADQGRPDRLVVDFAPTTPAGFAAHKNKDRVFGKLSVNETPESAPVSAAVPPPLRQQAAAAPPAPPTVTNGLALPGRKPVTPPAGHSTPAPAPVMKKPLIVLDPGHGGVDPGAIGANGIFEKHIALAMARELRELLLATGRYDVQLTRDSDIYKRLYQRVAFARQYDADLFISLHADSIRKAGVRGASVYTLSEKASDAQTARLAERENRADIIAGTDLSHEDEQVANILIDIAMRDTMNQSKFFANTLVDSMQRQNIRMLERPHRYAGFAVLKAPDIPSVLVEVGFMSNRREADMLARTEYRRELAQALVSGIDSYFQKLTLNNRM